MHGRCRGYIDIGSPDGRAGGQAENSEGTVWIYIIYDCVVIEKLLVLAMWRPWRGEREDIRRSCTRRYAGDGEMMQRNLRLESNEESLRHGDRHRQRGGVLVGTVTCG